ncbi:MAG: MopE-related protein [Pseudomonadota bacterium]|nr:MopE-related protein [Pseudomonadota bacterium]
MRSIVTLLLLGTLAGCEWVRIPENGAVYDLDGDGWASDRDCDDFNDNAYPLAHESCNGVDNNCSGSEDDADDATVWYRDLDGDVYGDAGAWITACDAPIGYVEAPFDCDDSDEDVFPGALEDDCTDPKDYNCDGFPASWDNDNDGVVGCLDCDDGNASRHPGAVETCNGVDDDCNGIADDGDLPTHTWWFDGDGDGWGGDDISLDACARPDGFSATDTDCDDADAARHPDAPEACDGLDNDCDDVVDEADRFGNDRWYTDLDGDGYGDAATWEASCEPLPGRLAIGDDCDDADAAIHPDATEHCDRIDEDCDGVVDDDAVDPLTWYRDDDRDAWGDDTDIALACTRPAGFIALPGDCDDSDIDVNPSASEYCDSVDDDCDGEVDEDDAVNGLPWYADIDGDGWGDYADVIFACAAPPDRIADGGDCDDTDIAFHPRALEIDCSDPADYNCDGSTGRVDLDVDGWSACQDCDDADADTSPSAEETCNGSDDDCDGDTDEDAADALAWYADVDGDGFGDDASFDLACDAPAGAVAVGGDCDDATSAVNPGEPEDCATPDDDDCDGDTNLSGIGCTDWYADGDGDGYGAETGACLCEAEEPYVVAVALDCDDADLAVNPDAVEVCGNGADDDCDDAAPGCGVAGERSLVEADGRIDGAAASDGLGTSLASPGDLDGDGLDDLLVGAPGVDDGAMGAGAVYLFGGPVTGTSTADADQTWLGEAENDNVGGAMVAGDFDGDGLQDLVFGAPYESSAGALAGAVYLLLGPAVGGSLSSADARYLGADADDYAGISLAASPDSDGDGDEELAVGASRETLESGGAGAVYVFDTTPLGTGAVADAPGLLVGATNGDFFGRALVAGDMDGDGLGDLAVGAYGDDGATLNGGAVYLYLGPIGGRVETAGADGVRYGLGSSDFAGYALAVGDTDADGYDDLVVGASGNDDGGANAGAAYVVRGPMLGTSFVDDDATLLGEPRDGAGLALAVGDLDDDGFDDVAVSSEGTLYGSAGAAWVAYGPLAGVSSLQDAEALLIGETAGDDAGTALAIPGDLDGDGFGDLVVGAAQADGTAGDAGAVYVIGGGPGL